MSSPLPSPSTAAPLLSVRGLKVAYGHIEAVKGIDFDLHEGRITTLVGANGAGKSTTLLALSGLVKKAAGQVTFGGQDIAALAPHRIVRSGLVQVAEGRATLTTLTVHENLELGAYTGRDRAQRARDLDYVYGLFPRLKERSGGLAGNLSGGEQQMLAIGRALMARPRVLLLDEPSMGLAPIIVQDIFRTLRAINQAGLTIFLVEQNVKQALKIADYGYVIETGRIVLADTGATLLRDPKVQDAYLGG
ncbi:ABC transporter ATP-binding protein [Xylophilus sp.]|uniref:ABC transporter ATP-binding protein n=1 Tax=Xylophilus sp. TaxID=2653893 RepID=UPI0013B8E428|nr:ABC transporter ATP-binding protein [Xylophilus sp.]KAF1044275.1 MAG: High-affinity branched-chain amino acid transport ATP-binding protein LivF [Xylophilus sp.]